MQKMWGSFGAELRVRDATQCTGWPFALAMTS